VLFLQAESSSLNPNGHENLSPEQPAAQADQSLKV
jgi:hypothetical protein